MVERPTPTVQAVELDVVVPITEVLTQEIYFWLFWLSIFSSFSFLGCFKTFCFIELDFILMVWYSFTFVNVKIVSALQQPNLSMQVVVKIKYKYVAISWS